MKTSVDVVIPALNEERALPGCIAKLTDLMDRHPERDWRIIVADNGSTDGTSELAHDLAAADPRISVLRLEEEGRGRTVKRAWIKSDAEVRCYMDADLSTDLRHLPDLISAVADESYDLAVGSRLRPGSVVEGRNFAREIMSRGYNLLIKLLFRTSFRDAQCGFKAISAAAAESLVPLVKNDNWFFDTELLLIAHKSGRSIKEVPVRWRDDPDSSVSVISAVAEDLRGLLRLRFGGIPRPGSDP